ncbi:MAG: hypothetical protein ACTSQC_05350 [Candidatus Heimdallarchaeaceae archaeon]
MATFSHESMELIEKEQIIALTIYVLATGLLSLLAVYLCKSISTSIWN